MNNGLQAYHTRRAHRWTPALLGSSGVAFWIDASQESFANNDPVGTATDRSGNGRDATQGTAGAKPTFKTGVLNGSTMPAFSFDGGDLLSTPAFSLTNSGIVFIGKQTTAGVFAEHGTNANVDGTFYLYGLTGYTYFRRGTTPSTGVDASSNWLGTSDAIGCAYYDGSSEYVRKNGTQLSTGSYTGGSTDSQSLFVGARSGPSAPYTGYFGEMLIIPSPTATLINRIEGYLAWKWGLVGSLDSAHQWKYAAPSR